MSDITIYNIRYNYNIKYYDS